MPARSLERACELYERGWAEQARFRFPSATRLLKRALVRSERVDLSPERAAIRARIFYTLGLCQGETSGMELAVEAFDAARHEIATIEDSASRTLLYASVDHNQGLMVMRMGQPDRAVEWFSRFLDSVEEDVDQTLSLIHI